MSSHVSQICYATRDVEATARAFAAIDGVGPFFVGEFEHRDVTYRNRKIGTLPVKVAFGYRNDMQYELIEPLHRENAFFSDMLRDRREAFHHSYESSTEDFDALIERYAASGEMVVYAGFVGPGARFAFVDATNRLGHFIELLETARLQDEGSNAILRAYERMREESRRWNGERPVRSIGEVLES